jgi:hypothetical protein
MAWPLESDRTAALSSGSPPASGRRARTCNSRDQRRCLAGWRVMSMAYRDRPRRKDADHRGRGEGRLLTRDAHENSRAQIIRFGAARTVMPAGREQRQIGGSARVLPAFPSHLRWCGPASRREPAADSSPRDGPSEPRQALRAGDHTRQLPAAQRPGPARHAARRMRHVRVSDQQGTGVCLAVPAAAPPGG